MTRARLPDRRESMTINVPHPGSEEHSRPTIYSVSLGFHHGVAHGDPREIFISCNKLTTALEVAGLEIATLASIALQHGASLRELAHSMPRDDAGKPQGAAGAVLDAIISEVGA